MHFSSSHPHSMVLHLVASESQVPILPGCGAQKKQFSDSSPTVTAPGKLRLKSFIWMHVNFP